MPSISVPAAIAIGAGVSAVGAVGGSIISSGAAKSAANEQLQAAQLAASTTSDIYNANAATLQQFIQPGVGATNELAGLEGQAGATIPAGTVTPGNPLTGAPEGAGGLVQPFLPTTAQLQQTPGYQFTLGQGLIGTQAGYAASGLGQSGAAEAGAASYATGLAQNTYQQQFNNYWSTLQNQFNMLNTTATTGASSAGALAGVGQATGQNLANIQTSAGAAQAAGTVGSANALTSGLAGVGNSASQYALLNALNSQGQYSPIPNSAYDATQSNPNG